jgi:hypothetical protein
LKKILAEVHQEESGAIAVTGMGGIGLAPSASEPHSSDQPF